MCSCSFDPFHHPCQMSATVFNYLNPIPSSRVVSIYHAGASIFDLHIAHQFRSQSFQNQATVLIALHWYRGSSQKDPKCVKCQTDQSYAWFHKIKHCRWDDCSGTARPGSCVEPLSAWKTHRAQYYTGQFWGGTFDTDAIWFGVFFGWFLHFWDGQHLATMDRLPFMKVHTCTI